MDLTAGFFYYIILKCTIIEKYAFFDLQTGFLHQTYMHISINPKKNQVLFLQLSRCRLPPAKRAEIFPKKNFEWSDRMVNVRPVRLGKTERMSFSQIDEVLEMPNLIEIQKDSYQWFLDK